MCVLNCVYAVYGCGKLSFCELLNSLRIDSLYVADHYKCVYN